MKNKPANDQDEAVLTPSARGRRLSLPLTDDGVIDWEATRPSQKVKFAELVSNDAIALEAIGLAAGSEDEEGEGVNPLSGITSENVAAGLDILSQANALAFKMILPRFQKHPFLKSRDNQPLPLVIEPDILQRCFTLTKEQHEELDPRVLAEVNKHTHQMPEWFTKHLNLFMLAGMFLKYTAANGMAAVGQQLKRDEARVKEYVAQHPTQAPPDTDARPSNGHAAEDQRRSGLRVGPQPVSNVMPPEGSEATAP